MGSQKQNLQGLLCRDVWLLPGGLCQQPEAQPLFLQLSLASRSVTDLLVRHNKPEDTGMMSLAERSQWDSDHTPTTYMWELRRHRCWGHQTSKHTEKQSTCTEHMCMHMCTNTHKSQSSDYISLKGDTPRRNIRGASGPL